MKLSETERKRLADISDTEEESLKHLACQMLEIVTEEGIET